MTADLTPATYRLGDSLGYTLTRASRAYETLLERHLVETGLHRIEYKVLYAIGREGRGTPGEVATMLGVEASTISRTLRSLKGAGYVVEGTSTEDRRMRILGLTSAGRTVLSRSIEAAVRVNRRLLKALDDDERAVLSALLNRIRGLEEMRPDPT
jgi:DNA-binding MarR family transcriptional regulator